MTVIVFSKNRAMQLDAFLRSYEDFVLPLGVISVLCHATTLQHAQAYVEVVRRYSWVKSLWQGNSFKEDLLGLLPQKGSVIFFVDDQIFVRPWCVVEQPGLSLRLGQHLTHCYPLNAEQLLPSFESHGAELLSWWWAEGHGDWGYPLSIDGHIFDLEEIRALIESSHFYSPNTFEGSLQQFAHMFANRRGTCYRRSRVVNIPWNRVQMENDNRHGDVLDVDEMLEHWEAGRQIDISPFYGVENVSCHQEFPLTLEERVS